MIALDFVFALTRSPRPKANFLHVPAAFQLRRHGRKKTLGEGVIFRRKEIEAFVREQ